MHEIDHNGLSDLLIPLRGDDGKGIKAPRHIGSMLQGSRGSHRVSRWSSGSCIDGLSSFGVGMDLIQVPPIDCPTVGSSYPRAAAVPEELSGSKASLQTWWAAFNENQKEVGKSVAFAVGSHNCCNFSKYLQI